MECYGTSRNLRKIVEHYEKLWKATKDCGEVLQGYGI